jgi:hypothetical protein
LPRLFGEFSARANPLIPHGKAIQPKASTVASNRFDMEISLVVSGES